MAPDTSITPELVQAQSFTTAFRGYDTGEVKAFLNRVATELRAWRERAEGLESAWHSAEERAARPPVLDEDTLMAAVGEETATILRTARAAAAEMRSRAAEETEQAVAGAKEEAERILAEAREEAERARNEATSEADRLRQEAESALAEATAAAEARAAELLDAARREASELVEKASGEADGMRAQAEKERLLTIEGANSTRDRILEDLSRRRRVATVQIEQLRAGRERLIESYAIVRRTLEEVQSELSRADAEARAAADDVGRRLRDDPEPELSEATREVTALETVEVAAADEGRSVSAVDQLFARIRGTGAGDATPGAETESPAEAEPAAPGESVTEPEGIEVEGTGPEPGLALAGEPRPADTEAADTQADEAGDAEKQAAESHEARSEPAQPESTRSEPAQPESEPPSTRARRGSRKRPAGEGGDTGPSVTEAAGSVTVQEAEPAPDTPVPDGDEALLQAREFAIVDLEVTLTRRLKRALQDEQNDVLDRLRGLKGAPTAATLLPAEDTQVATFASAAAPLLAEAATAGAIFTDEALGLPGRDEPVNVDVSDLAQECGSAIVSALRRRLEQAIDTGAGDDQAVLVEALGSAYREWKTQRIERLAGDALSAAFSRGTWHAAPEGAQLRWVVEDADGPCPDCDDDALAGDIPKGESFPTGQAHPPAHSGCRCLLVPTLART